MELEQHRQRLQLVWASVFLMSCAAYGFTTLMAFASGAEIVPMAIAIAVGMLFSIIAVPVLLLFRVASPRLLKAGHILVCVQVFCLVAALVFAIVMMANSL